MATAELDLEWLNELAVREMVREVGRCRERLAAAEAKVAALRASRDALIACSHEHGVPVAALAQDAGISRMSAYKAIERHRRNDG